jgi:F0F1-type ATP synthase alpha subunit
MGELVYFPDKNIYGSALNLENDQIGCIVFAEESKVSQGDTVIRTDRLVSVPCGVKLLGRVVNSLGLFIDGRDKTPEELEETLPTVEDLVKNDGVALNQNLMQGIRVSNMDEEYPLEKLLLDNIDEEYSTDVKSECDALIHMNIERKAPGVITRLSVSEPLLTGYKIVDGLLPMVEDNVSLL